MAISSTPTYRHPVTRGGAEKLEIITGWKDIATYVKAGVRTVQRYERELGLPIRRPARKRTGSVLATKAELDGWIAARAIRQAFRQPRASVDNATPLAEIRWHLQELHRIREESSELQVTLRASLELFRKNLRSALLQKGEDSS